jgi:hypothetical protein
MGLPQQPHGLLLPELRTRRREGWLRPLHRAAALKALEWAGVLTWQHRITRVRERCRDLFGREGWCWRVVRTSNAYVFRDPKPPSRPGDSIKSENRSGTLDQDLSLSLPTQRRGLEAKKARCERGAAALAEPLLAPEGRQADLQALAVIRKAMEVRLWRSAT